MNIVNRRSVRRMMAAHPETSAALEAWWRLAKGARWVHFEECHESIRSTDQVGRCLIFDILGNRYRLITVVSWRNQRIYVKALLPHREYERNKWHKWAF